MKTDFVRINNYRFINVIFINMPFFKPGTSIKKTTTWWLAVTFLVLTCLRCTNNETAGETSGRENKQGSVAGSNGSVANAANGAVDFITAARATTPAVVHIKTVFDAAGYGRIRGRLFGAPYGGRPAMGSGSGVTVSVDGYIATNNHVIENASTIQVIYPDRRAFTARLIGRDPNTDLALLKVDATGLPAIKLGNSDAVEVGEWVLAVGYPLSLNTTVTAGIISAKGRSIGIIGRSSMNNYGANTAPATSSAVESFLQTDAAINPGNSGGALVNTAGELVGINTAIASQTGSYAGYAFAVPVNLVKKVLDDLKKFGSVKRAVLGVSFPSPLAEEQYFRQQGIDPAKVRGVYITDVQAGSAAAAAGLKEGDIIQSIDGVPFSSTAEFSELIARQRPGDKITLSYLRNGKTGTATVTLKGEAPATAQTGKSLQEIYNRLGAEIAPLTDAAKQQLQINSGVLVTKVRSGGFFDVIGIPPGTIIVMVNGKPVNNPDDLDAALLAAQRGMIQILGIAPDGSRIAFNLSLGT